MFRILRIKRKIKKEQRNITMFNYSKQIALTDQIYNQKLNSESLISSKLNNNPELNDNFINSIHKQDISEHLDIFPSQIKIVQEQKNQLEFKGFIKLFQNNNQQTEYCTTICDESGKFVFYDQLTTKIFDQNRIHTKGIYDFMLKDDNQRFIQTNLNQILYTIYSRTAKKQCLSQIRNHTDQILHSNNKQHHQVQLSQFRNKQGIEIYFQFLRSLVSEIKKITLIIDRSILQMIIKNQPNIQVNITHPIIQKLLEEQNDISMSIDLLLLKTKIVQPQNLPYNHIKQTNPKIKKWQQQIDNLVKLYTINQSTNLQNCNINLSQEQLKQEEYLNQLEQQKMINKKYQLLEQQFQSNQQQIIFDNFIKEQKMILNNFEYSSNNDQILIQKQQLYLEQENRNIQDHIQKFLSI